MRIDALIQKKKYNCFSSSGDLVRCVGGCCALYSRALVYIFYPLNYTVFLSQAVRFTAKFLKKIHTFNALQCSGLHCSPHSALHCTLLGKVFKSLDIVKYIYNFFALLFREYLWILLHCYLVLCKIFIFIYEYVLFVAVFLLGSKSIFYSTGQGAARLQWMKKVSLFNIS